ncbi:hypothetical protein ACFL6C_02935 [Myxococcota bacterium]
MEEPHVSRFETNFLTVCVMLTTGCGGWATGTIVQADGCGDNVCQAEEDCNNCAADCGACAACGNSTCEPTESCHDCPGDCGICEGCGNTICDPQESCSDCPGDCGDCESCGDTICDPREDCRSCPLDCGACDSCGNATCDPTEDCTSCTADCSCQTCGDGSCDPTEDCYLCPLDCGACVPVCGDGRCEPGEDCTTCANDCSCARCGDGVCDPIEHCVECPEDCGGACANLDVPLIIRDVAGVARHNEPVSSGVPMPLGVLQEPVGLKVTDSSGQPVPAQFKVLERWREHGQDGSIRWLLVTFLADVPANGRSEYRLGFGINPSPVDPITVLDAGSSFHVAGQAFAKDFSSPFDLVLTAADGAQHHGHDLSTLAWTVEETGPVRVMLKAESETEPDRFGFIAWIYAYAGLERWDMTLVLKNTPRTPRGPFYFRDFSVRWDRPGTEYALGGDVGTLITGTIGDTEHVFLYQDSSGTDRWDLLNDGMSTPTHDGVAAFVLNWDDVTWRFGIPEFLGFKVLSSGNEVEAGNQALGWARLGSSGVLVRDFWQQYPKAVEVEPDRLTVRLWPDYWNGHDGLHWLDDVQRKAHDLSFVARSVSDDDALAFNHPLVIYSGVDWYRATGVAGYVSDNHSEQEPDPTHIGQWEHNWVMWGGNYLDRIRRRYHESPMDPFIRTGDPFYAYRTQLAGRHSSGMTPMWLDRYSFPEDEGLLRSNTYCSPVRDTGEYSSVSDHHGYKIWNPQHWTAREIFDAYRLFGDPLAYDAVEKTGVYMQFWVQRRQTTPIGETRQDALPQNVLAEAYRVTGDPSLLASLNDYLDVMWGTINKERGYYVPNVRRFAPMGADKSFMLAFLAEGLEQTYSLTGDQRAVDMITGITDYVMAEAYVGPCFAVIYEAPIDPVLRDQELEAARLSEKALCERGSGWQEWRLMSLAALSYLHTGEEKYFTVFDDLYQAQLNEGGLYHVWDSRMDQLLERPRADTTPPPVITDLSASVQGAKVTLTWTAPVDAASYQIKIAEYSMVDRIVWPDQAGSASNWWAAEHAEGEPIPSAPGTIERAEVSDLPAATYAIGIRSLDAASNRSGISNQVVVSW